MTYQEVLWRQASTSLKVSLIHNLQSSFSLVAFNMSPAWEQGTWWVLLRIPRSSWTIKKCNVFKKWIKNIVHCILVLDDWRKRYQRIYQGNKISKIFSISQNSLNIYYFRPLNKKNLIWFIKINFWFIKINIYLITLIRDWILSYVPNLNI